MSLSISTPRDLWGNGLLFLSAKEVARCAPVSKEWKVVTTFFGLGSNWWKQVIDGEHQHHGPLVFDQGLHKKGRNEPGFLASIRRASLFISRRFASPGPSLEQHQAIHRLACAHFRGAETGTEITAEEAGQYRHKGSRCRIEIWESHPEAQELYEIWRLFYYKAWRQSKEREFEPRLAEGRQEHIHRRGEARHFVENVWPQYWERRVSEINQYVRQASQSLGLDEPLVTLQIHSEMVYVDYPTTYFRNKWCPLREAVDEIAERITRQFNEEIGRATTLEEKVRSIAKLFQLREWLHAFSDGNTRTNLVELGWLLSLHGANPAILDQPFDASLLTLDGWVAYLNEGMEKWRQERGRLARE